MAELTLIAAVGRNRVIGKDNALCWHIPEDLARFRRLTQGQAVIMGRKTWESLPSAVRPLPGRQNILVSRQPGYGAPGAQVASSLDEALELVTRPRVFIIGGEQLYRQALARAKVLELTEVDLTPDGDAFFPEVDPREWRVDFRYSPLSASEVPFSFARYLRSP